MKYKRTLRLTVFNRAEQEVFGAKLIIDPTKEIALSEEMAEAFGSFTDKLIKLRRNYFLDDSNCFQE